MCLICERIKMIKKGTNTYFVRKLKTGLHQKNWLN